MTLSTIDHSVALVVIDLQHLIVAGSAAQGSAEAVAQSARLADEFRERGLPVVLVQALGRAPGRTEHSLAAAAAVAEGKAAAPQITPEAMSIVPELEGDAIRIVKRTYGAFHGTDLHEQLQQAGVTQIVLAGIATSKGVESTGRAAHEHGYNVTFATDAMTEANPVAHRHSIDVVFPDLGERGTVDEIIAMLPPTPASITTVASNDLSTTGAQAAAEE